MLVQQGGAGGVEEGKKGICKASNNEALKYAYSALSLLGAEALTGHRSEFVSWGAGQAGRRKCKASGSQGSQPGLAQR